MTDTATTVKKTRTPRGYETVLKGAKSLNLAERVQLVKEISAMNQTEVSTLQKQAEEAAGLLKP